MSIVSEFNDAVSARTPLRLYLSGRDEFLDVVPYVPCNVFGVPSGAYYEVDNPNTLVTFDPNRFSSSLPLPRVGAVRFVTPSGEAVSVVPRSCEGCRLEFQVRGAQNGEVYRVEIQPDSQYAISEISQIHAGNHTMPVQTFSVALTSRSAQIDFRISIFHVDAETAKRDRNQSAPEDWMDYFYVERP